jgi:hypothetical protein
MQEVERLCDQVVVVAHGRTVAIGSVAELAARCGESDFEETFVKLAFGERTIGSRPGASRGRGGSIRVMRDAWIVYAKELIDALRDRRTLLMVLLSSVAIGPLVLVLVSSLVAGMEKRAEARELVVHGMDHAPTLRNYLQRQTYTLREAPADYEQQLKDSRLAHPVLVVPADFEAEIARGAAPVVELVSSAANQRAQTGTGAVVRLLRGFNQEQATCAWPCAACLRHVLETVRVEERDLADPATRAPNSPRWCRSSC